MVEVLRWLGGGGCGLDAGCWILDARKMVSLGKIGKYKYYRTLRRARERGSRDKERNRERVCV